MTGNPLNNFNTNIISNYDKCKYASQLFLLCDDSLLITVLL
jgi:hypothetical protein